MKKYRIQYEFKNSTIKVDQIRVFENIKSAKNWFKEIKNSANVQRKNFKIKLIKE